MFSYMEHLPYTCRTSVHVSLDLLSYIEWVILRRGRREGEVKRERKHMCVHSWCTAGAQRLTWHLCLPITPHCSESASLTEPEAHGLDLFASEPPAVSSTTTSPEQEGVGHVQCHASFNVRLGIWTQAIIQVRWAVSPASQLSSFSNFLNCSGSDPLQNVHFANVFFCALGCHLILVTTSCALQKLSSLMQSKAIYSNSLALFYWNNLLIL